MYSQKMNNILNCVVICWGTTQHLQKESRLVSLVKERLKIHPWFMTDRETLLCVVEFLYHTGIPNGQVVIPPD